MYTLEQRTDGNHAWSPIKSGNDRAALEAEGRKLAAENKDFAENYRVR